jgi:hypothetical protein
VIEGRITIESEGHSWTDARGRMLVDEESNEMRTMRMRTPNHGRRVAPYEMASCLPTQMILVMLRGRHRGLPVAIDRAIMLPREYARLDRRSATVPSEVRTSAQTGTGASGRRGTLRSGDDGVAEKREGRGYGRGHGHGDGQSR